MTLFSCGGPITNSPIPECFTPILLARFPEIKQRFPPFLFLGPRHRTAYAQKPVLRCSSVYEQYYTDIRIFEWERVSVSLWEMTRGRGASYSRGRPEAWSGDSRIWESLLNIKHIAWKLFPLTFHADSRTSILFLLKMYSIMSIFKDMCVYEKQDACDSA